MQKSSFALFLVACAFLLQANAVYFQFYTIFERCLLEDLPQHESLIGHFENLDHEISRYHVRISDPNNKNLLNQDLVGAKGKFAFTTKDAGLHKVCFAPLEGEWFDNRKKTRIALRLTGGESNYEEIANKEHLSQLQVLIMKLKDHAEDFIKMQENSRADESQLVEQNQNVNERVIYTTIFQTLIILVSGCYQIYSLRKYFIQKKLL